MSSAMQTYWVVIFLFILVAFMLAFIRKGKAGMTMTARRREIDLAASPAEVFATLMRIPRPFVVDDSKNGNVVILSSPVSFGSWGFFYPVFIQQGAGSGSHLTVGCKSKVLQIGPIVTRNHKKCVEAILDQFAIAPARVVR
jgi:hypothetical protein